MLHVKQWPTVPELNYLGVSNTAQSKEYMCLLYACITWKFAVNDIRFGWSLANNFSVCKGLDLTVLTYKIKKKHK